MEGRIVQVPAWHKDVAYLQQVIDGAVSRGMFANSSSVIEAQGALNAVTALLQSVVPEGPEVGLGDKKEGVN